MNTPLVSVVIPAYNQANFVAEAVQSVLDQTYSHHEVIVVNDSSQDNTSEIVNSFTDPRVKQVVHPENRGLPASRNSGILASSGELIALLDADDYFHPHKLAKHVNFLSQNPQVGVSYNHRYELNHGSKTIRELWIPPLEADLKDLVLGFPFSPSDMVIRREWAFKVGLFDESFIYGGEDTDFPCRLALAGCEFRGINEALNYRRYHSGRPRRNLPHRLGDVERAQNATFSSSNCPEDVLALKPVALKHHLMVLMSLAFIQGESELGQKYARQIVEMDPGVIKGLPCELVEFLLMESIADENRDHEELMESIFRQLPPELAYLSAQYDWAVAYGYLQKGSLNVIWGRTETGSSYLQKAAELGASCDQAFLQKLTHQLLGYENEFGRQEADNMMENLLPYLERVGSRKCVREVVGLYFANLALRDYQSSYYKRVPAEVARAAANKPSFLVNRGMLAIFFRSLFSREKHQSSTLSQ